MKLVSSRNNLCVPAIGALLFFLGCSGDDVAVVTDSGTSVDVPGMDVSPGDSGNDAPSPSDAGTDTFVPWEPDPTWVTCEAPGGTLDIGETLPADCERLLSSVLYQLMPTGERPALNALSNLRAIDGSVTIVRTGNLLNLEGLNQLQYVGGGFTIAGQSRFESFEPLNELRRVDGPFSLSSLLQSNLRGLENLESVGGLSLFELTLMEDISGLSGLRRIRGDLFINNVAFRRLDVAALLAHVEVDGETDVNVLD